MPDSLARSVEVSPEMTSWVGPGPLPQPQSGRAALVIDVGHPARLAVHADAARARIGQAGDTQVVLTVTRSIVRTMFDWTPALLDGQCFYLTDAQAVIARSLFGERDCDGATTAFRLAKSIELLCELIAGLKAGTMGEHGGDRGLSRQDLERLAIARQIVDRQWSEKLTIDQLARRCGLNRSKLTRGFRDVYRSSISEALAERRLAEARRQLLGTDLPVGVIGYRSGYLNNASFTRAFGRRFGVSPSDFRGARAA